MVAPNNPSDFQTTYSGLISQYTTKIDVIKQEIRDLMADPVGAGMTNGAFLELIKDTALALPIKRLVMEPQIQHLSLLKSARELACMKNQKQFVLSWQQNDAKIN